MGAEFTKSETPFQKADVQVKWLPQRLRCLIIGESPGAPGSAYFYDPIPPTGGDPVIVRRLLLRALTKTGILPSPNLEAFKDSGFLFDHAIREQLAMTKMKSERRNAERFESKLAASATHLTPLIVRAESVWAMGWIARNAVVRLFPSIPMKRRSLTPPYRLNEKIFVSRYLTRYTRQENANQVVKQITEFINPPLFAAGRRQASFSSALR